MDKPQHVQSVLCRMTDELFFACHITLPFYRHESSWDLFQRGNPWQLLTAGERDYWCHLWSHCGGWFNWNFFLHHSSELSLAYPFLHSKQTPLITLCGPTLCHRTLGFVQVKPWIHDHGKIWKMPQKLLNSTSPFPSNVSQWKCYENCNSKQFHIVPYFTDTEYSRAERNRERWTQTFVFLLKMPSTQNYLVPFSFGCKTCHVGSANRAALGHHLPLPPLILFLTQTT